MIDLALTARVWLRRAWAVYRWRTRRVRRLLAEMLGEPCGECVAATEIYAAGNWTRTHADERR